MTFITRRLALGAALSLLAGAALAEDHVRAVELKKVFPYLDVYDKLPAAERSRFQLVYRLTVKGAPATALRAAYLTGGQRSPVRFGADMRVLNLPHLSALSGSGRIELATPVGAKVAMDLEVAPMAVPAAQMDAHDLALGMQQASTAIHKAAGMLSFAAPKMERAEFKGATGGKLVDASGKVSPLPVVAGSAVFDPAKAPAARWLRFDRPPTSITYGPAK